MTMASLDSQWTLIRLLLLFLTTVASAINVRDMNIDEYVNFINPPAVHRFLNEHGDTILCVLYTDQISLQGSEQRSMKIRDDGKTKSGLNFSRYDDKTECPEGTVAIMETKREHVERLGSVTRFISKRKSLRYSAEQIRETSDGLHHEYGVASFRTREPINGASGGINVWQPDVVSDDNGVFSLGQIWVANDLDLLETMEIGWIVNPSVYGDSRTRLFIYWTADGYKNTGCWNTNCHGFVLAPGSLMYLGSPVTPVSTYNGEQRQITIKVIKEMQGGNGARWSLYINNQLLGWWLGSLFKNLQFNANRVDFGGEVAFLYGSNGLHFTKTDMGSGHFPSEGFGRSAYIRDIQITDDHGVSIDIPGERLVSRQQCYDVSIFTDNQKGKHIFLEAREEIIPLVSYDIYF